MRCWAAVDEKMGAFHVYALDTVEKINADVRVVDASGGLSNVGLLQVRTGAGFGRRLSACCCPSLDIRDGKRTRGAVSKHGRTNFVKVNGT